MKISRITAALLLATVSGSLFAQTLVTVNGTKIDSKEIDRQVKFLVENRQVPSDSPELRDELVNNAVTRVLVAQEARRLKLDEQAAFKEATSKALAAAKEQGVDKKASFKQDWENYQVDLLNEAFILNVLRNHPVSESDIRKVYDETTKLYRGTSEIQMGEILTPKQEDAQKAIQELNAKKSFAEVARKYSANPDAKQTGGIDTHYTRLKDLEQAAPPVYAVIKDLKKGQYTPTPLVGNGLYAVFYVNDKRTVKIPSFEDSKAPITRNLQGQQLDQAIGALYQKAKIVPAQ